LIFGFRTQDSIVDAGRGSDDTKIRRLKGCGLRPSQSRALGPTVAAFLRL
jgi:hypothetical protein